MSSSYGLRTAKLDLSTVHPKHRMDMWRSHNSGLFTLKPLHLEDRRFMAKTQSYRFGNSVLGEISVSGNVVRRDFKNVRLIPDGLLVVRMHRSGYTRGVMSDANFEMRSDRITIFDFHQSIHAKTENVDYVSFTCRHSAVGYDPTKHPRLMQIDVNTPAGRLLKSNLEWILEALPNVTVQQAEALSEGLCGLIQGLITRDLVDETIQRRFSISQEIAVRRYMEANLKNPGLNSDHICTAVGVSKVVLYRMFAAEGGVRRAIQMLRLENALEDLSNSEPSRGVVLRVARHWGFYDQAHFSRAFRNAFGFRPSDAVASSLTDTPESGSLSTGANYGLNEVPLISLYTQQSQIV